MSGQITCRKTDMAMYIFYYFRAHQDGQLKILLCQEALNP